MCTSASPEQIPAIALTGVSKVYGAGPTAVNALRDVTARVERGSFTAVMGPSGSGKSTFLQCAAGLDQVSAGKVELGDTDLGTLNDTQLTELRRSRIGFVFQSFNLIPALTVAHNITLPLRLGGRRVDPEWFGEIVRRTGLTGLLDRFPAQLSGGQQQRVTLARALAGRPEVIFADEPTGALDLATGREVLGLLSEASRELRQTVVMVTHDPAAAAYAGSVWFLADGRLVGTESGVSAERIAELLAGLGG